MKLTSLLTILSILITLAPAAHAETSSSADFFADAVYATSVHTYAAENALGAPDGINADFKDEDATVTLDLGEGEEGLGDLTFYSKAFEFGAVWQVEFFDAQMTELQSSSAGFTLFENETVVSYDLETPYRYVRFTCVNGKLWGLDAIEAEGVSEPEMTDVETNDADVSETPADEETTEDGVSVPPRGLLVKLVDDGDAATTVDAAVYVIGADAKRHAFPSEAVYRSWFESYDDVAFIDPENLAGYELGRNVTVRPGTWLVKVTADPKVYAVEPGGILRWVTSESIAAALWGNDWNKRVIDVPDVLWNNYTVGEPITTEILPSGSLAILSTGEVVYLDATASYSIPGDVLASLRLTTDFAVSLGDDRLARYADGGLLTDDPDISYPF